MRTWAKRHQARSAYPQHKRGLLKCGFLCGEHPELKTLHDGVGQQLFTRFTYQALRILAGICFDVKGDVLADPNIRELTQANVGKVVRHRLALRVKEARKGENVNGRVEVHIQCDFFERNR